MNEKTKEYLDKIKPCDMGKPFVFVSYARSDADVVYPIAVALQEKGINIWIDKELKSAAGEFWQEKAFEAMENYHCYKILFFISEDSITSAPVCAEMIWSMSEDVRDAHNSESLKIVPVNLVKKDLQLKNWIQKELVKKYQDVQLSSDDFDCLRNISLREGIDGGGGNWDKKIKNKFQIASIIFKKRFMQLSGITYLTPDELPNILINLSPASGMYGAGQENAGGNAAPGQIGGEKGNAAGNADVAAEISVTAEKETGTGKREKEVPGQAEKKKVYSATGDLAFTLYGVRDTRNQSDLMILTFGKVLKNHPEYIDMVTDTFHCVSDIDYSDKRNRTESMPSYFRVCHTYDIFGKTVCIGTAYGFSEKLRQIAKLLELTGDKCALQIDGYELPEVKNRQGGSRPAPNPNQSDGQAYYVFKKKRSGNQSNMMWDVFKELAQRYPEKIDGLTVLSAVKRVEQVEKAGTKDARPTYFRGCKKFHVNGTEYYVGTSFSMDAKIAQIRRMLKLCDAPSDSFSVDGTLEETVSPQAKTLDI